MESWVDGLADSEVDLTVYGKAIEASEVEKEEEAALRRSHPKD